MNQNLFIFITLALCFLICMMMTRFLVLFLPRMGMVDDPEDPRRLHESVTPTGGGIAVLTSFLLGFVLIDYKIYDFYYSPYIALPIFILGLISLFDDIKGMPIFVRLAIHLCAAAYIAYELLLPYQLFHGELGFWADFTLAFIALAGFANIYNFMDGMDGLTASQSVHLSLTMIILCYLRYDIIIHTELVLLIAILVLVCSSAFGIYNWHPAKIFIGDIGSICLGILLGLCLILIAASSMRLFVSAIIASLYYIGDGGLTILIRLLKGERIWLPHVNHFFQQAIRKEVPQRKILFEIILCNYWLMMLAISALFYPVISLMFAIGLVARTLFKLSKFS
jgi:UDP-N-acetylmuramyl pentapeptide phosphotransferase/UDP-N-acetylglucosamine-1-phosphate transferase